MARAKANDEDEAYITRGDVDAAWAAYYTRLRSGDGESFMAANPKLYAWGPGLWPKGSAEDAAYEVEAFDRRAEMERLIAAEESEWEAKRAELRRLRPTVIDKLATEQATAAWAVTVDRWWRTYDAALGGLMALAVTRNYHSDHENAMHAAEQAHGRIHPLGPRQCNERTHTDAAWPDVVYA